MAADSSARRRPRPRPGRRPTKGEQALQMADACSWPDERSYQAHIVRVARANGWRVFHVPRMKAGRDSQWMTNTLLPGWPDLVMIRPPKVMFIEVKGPNGKPSPDQRSLMGALQRITKVVAAFARPDDWPALERHLTAPDSCPQ